MQSRMFIPKNAGKKTIGALEQAGFSKGKAKAMLDACQSIEVEKSGAAMLSVLSSSNVTAFPAKLPRKNIFARKFSGAFSYLKGKAKMLLGIKTVPSAEEQLSPSKLFSALSSLSASASKDQLLLTGASIFSIGAAASMVLPLIFTPALVGTVAIPVLAVAMTTLVLSYALLKASAKKWEWLPSAVSSLQNSIWPHKEKAE